VAGNGISFDRREFLTGALAVSSLALSGLPEPAAAQTAGEPIQKIGEIRSQGGKLRGVVTIRNEKRMMPEDTQAGKLTPREAMLRYFEGKDVAGNVVWPPAPSAPGALRPPLPGPTLRARVGDTVELTCLNHIKVEDFAGTIDRAETGDVAGCDTAVEARRGTKLYPEGAADAAPDCFHGSSTANMHFHGTHVTPDGLGDNVLLQLRPNPQVTEVSVQADFAQIFKDGPPAHWKDLPANWRERQLALLKEYDDTAVWQGKRGTIGHPALPPANRLLPRTLARIEAGLWPQYQVGAYPFCYKLTEYLDAQGKRTRYQMGQCPGTHWYHAHKHGSTAINVMNGMAGVFVIEGAYDDALVKIYPNLKQTEKVLIVQNFSVTPNLMNQVFQCPSLWVNGQLQPTLAMRPGEIQLWRLVNASVRAVTTLQGFKPAAGAPPGLPEIRQVAQDGVQFRFENYQDQPLLPRPPAGALRSNTFAPGNRVDMLVKAPPTPGSYNFVVTDTTKKKPPEITLVTLTVAGAPMSPAMDFPVQSNYPDFLPFLEDIKANDVRIWRKLDFGWEPKRSSPGLGDTAPKFMIDGRQFSDDRYNQTMVLGDTEEWTLTNATGRIAHPFHIHINPFQVVEAHDPTSGQTYKPTSNYIWQDVVAIPPAKTDGDGNLILDPNTGNALEPGYVKIRHRFVDFPGSYVLHCHMLAHEDRGMMQLVRVIPPDALVDHH
jgi:FtsP/CotA-like multicopper oxidase with cupredoxin domain